MPVGVSLPAVAGAEGGWCGNKAVRFTGEHHLPVSLLHCELRLKVYIPAGKQAPKGVAATQGLQPP